MSRKEYLESKIVEHETLDEQLTNNPDWVYKNCRRKLKDRQFREKHGKTRLDKAMEDINGQRLPRQTKGNTSSNRQRQ